MIRFVLCGTVALCATSAVLWSGPAKAEVWVPGAQTSQSPEIIDPQPYEVDFDAGSANSELTDFLKDSSELWTKRKDPASGAAGLVSLGQADYRRLVAMLYAEGYYSGTISILIDGVEAADRPLIDPVEEVAQVVIRIEPGQRFAFGDVAIENPPPRPANRFDRSQDEARREFVTGKPARAGIITDSGLEAIGAWRQAGHPKARVEGRTVVADHATTELDATIVMDPGPAARFGKVTVKTDGDVDPEFVRYMAEIPEGGSFDPDRLERATDRLVDLRVFRAVRAVEAEEVAEDGTLPILIETTPRLPRRYGFGATASSTDGLGLEAFWLNRNLLGRAERLRFDASISGIFEGGGIENYDYEFTTSFTKPGVFDPDTDLNADLGVVQNIFPDYREQSVTTSLGFSRRFTPELDGATALRISYSDITDDQGNREFLTFALPTALTLDRRDDELDATSGYYLSGELKPFYETEFETVAMRSEIEGRTYFELPNETTVFAVRAKFGTIYGGKLTEISPDQTFFTGGGGSVRGYGFRSNGIEVNGNTTGGRSAIELSTEVRQRFGERLGAVGFADAGLVGRELVPSEDARLRAGVGAGFRYYTGLGPLRFDVALPLNRGNGDPSLTFYVGIGQAF